MKSCNLGQSLSKRQTDANGGDTLRVTVTPLWTQTSESGFPPQVTATIILNRPGRDNVQGTSVHLRGSQTASVCFQLCRHLVTRAGDTLQVNFDGTDTGNGSNGNIRITSATIAEQGAGTAAVTALATDAANQVVSPLRNEVAAVEARSVNNQTAIDTNRNNITANTTKNTEQDREITALQQRTPFTPSEAALDLLRRALEVHMDGDPTYTGRIRSVVRWQVGAVPPTTLDDEGVTVSTPQRRTISGLGTQNDKIYYVKTNSFNSDAGGHLIYRVTASGGDEPIFGTVVNSAGTRVWQAISTDPLDPNIFQIITTATLTAGIPYQTGDTIGWAFETFENGHARVVPVIIRADGTTSVQGNDVNFNSDNAATNFDPDKIAIVTGNHISDVWVAKLDGLGARHSEIAAADPREAGLGFRVAGAGRDILTLSGDIEWTGNSFIVKEGALKIRKADGTIEVFTAGGEIPTATINAAIATYLADNPISPTQATVVQRNYDQTVLQTAASASLGGNTGLWVIANQQTGTQGIPTANVSAGTGITLPAAVNGIVNLPPGTMCRIRSGTDILVMFIPGTSGTAQTGLEIVALLEGLSGNARLAATAIDGLANVATSGSYNDLTDTPTLSTVATSGDYNDLANQPAIPANLNDLTDVNAGSPANGQTIVWNGTAWVAQTPAGGGGTGTVATLNDIGNVGITAPEMGQVLTWNGTAWVNQTEPDDPNLHAFSEGLFDSPVPTYRVAGSVVSDPTTNVSISRNSGGFLTLAANASAPQLVRGYQRTIEYGRIAYETEFELGELGQIDMVTFGFGMTQQPDNTFDRDGTKGIKFRLQGNSFVEVIRQDRAYNQSAFLNLETGAWEARDTTSSSPNFLDAQPLVIGRNNIRFAIYNEGTTAAKLFVSINGETIVDVVLTEVPDLTGDFFGDNWVNRTAGRTQPITIYWVGVSDPNARDLFAQVRQAAGGVTSINDLSDVDTTTNEPKNDDVLVWDGSNWVPSTPTAPTPAAGSITSTELANDSVTREKIADKAVDTEEIADNAVGETQLSTAVQNRLVPPGGTTGQILAKASNTPNDDHWIDPPSGGGGGLPSGFAALPFLTYELRGASTTEPSTAAYTISGATLSAEFQALSALRQRDFFLTFNFGEGTQTPKEWVALAPFSVSMEGVAASGSRSFGFRVPGPASQVDGARVTITLDANNKITSIAFQATSGGQGQEMQLTRPAGLYGDTGGTF